MPVASTDPLFTSGTGGEPRGVPRDNGGHAAAPCWSLEALYDVGPGEVMFTVCDVGRVPCTPTSIVYAPSSGARPPSSSSKPSHDFYNEQWVHDTRERRGASPTDHTAQSPAPAPYDRSPI